MENRQCKLTKKRETQRLLRMKSVKERRRGRGAKRVTLCTSERRRGNEIEQDWQRDWQGQSDTDRKTEMSADVKPAENSLQSPKWSVYTWAVIPMNEHTSTQVNNPDKSVIRKERQHNKTLLTQHIMRWQGSRMNCWHKNSSTIMR